MGMIAKVSYLVEWKRVDAPPPVGRKARKAAKKAGAAQA
jgi:large subunit ribosomal protein L30